VGAETLGLPVGMLEIILGSPKRLLVFWAIVSGFFALIIK